MGQLRRDRLGMERCKRRFEPVCNVEDVTAGAYTLHVASKADVNCHTYRGLHSRSVNAAVGAKRYANYIVCTMTLNDVFQPVTFIMIGLREACVFPIRVRSSRPTPT